MLKKLNSVLKNPVLRLTLRATIFAAAFFAFSHYRSFFSFLLFVVAGTYFYLRPAFEIKKHFWLFLVFIFTAFLSAIQFSALGDKWSLVAAIIFGAIFFFLLGVKNLIFINRSLVFDFTNTSLFFAVFIVFFMADKSDWFFIKYPLAFAALFMLFREFIFLQEAQEPSRPIVAKINLFSASFAILISQFMLAASYLPIGFLNAGALCLVAVLCLKDLTINHFHGSLNRVVILRNATLAVIFSLLIFAASKWQP